MLAKEPRIFAELEPVVEVSALADNRVNFMLHPWVNTDDYWSVNRSLLEQVKKSFDKEDISMQFAQ
ncbi:MAG: mechanosensitive ion channel family protein [Arenicella sp.]|nr:mechanosensitive ion channel family protein [Arenicella sp.]